MALALTLQQGGQHHAIYRGGAEAGGTPVQQLFTLPFLEHILTDKDFSAQLEVTTKSLDGDIQSITGAVLLDENQNDPAVSGLPSYYLRLDIDNSDNADAEFEVLLNARHSIVR